MSSFDVSRLTFGVSCVQQKWGVAEFKPIYVYGLSFVGIGDQVGLGGGGGGGGNNLAL